MELMQVIGLFIFVGLIFSAAFFEFSVITWTVTLGVVLFLLSIFGWLPLVAMIIFWLGYLAAAAFANLSDLRQRYLVKPSVLKLQQQMPSISATERTAIEAGDTWWEKDLFCGRPDWNKLFHIPKPTLSVEEQAFLDNQVNQLCAMANDWEIVYEKKDLSKTVWNFLKKEKFFGMVIPKQYGGLGFSALAHSTVVTKIASRSVSLAVTAMVPNSLGPGELIVHYGTDEQKNYYLPRLASGQEMPCFALTGPEAGSDAGAITDTGIVCYGEYQGKQTLGIRLSWDKRYITLAPVATVLGIAFKLYDPEHLLGDKENIGITLALIPTSQPGVEIGNRHLPMYLGFMNGPTRGKDVFLPMEWIIGGQAMIGQGWRMLMECLSIGRSISLPALSTGSAKTIYRMTGAYSRIRRQFNAPISAFEGIEEALGYIAGYTYLLEAARTMTAGAIDQNINPSIVSAIAKYHMTEMNRTLVSHAMDIHAGHMVQAGPNNFLVNIYNAVPISITVEGANILTRNLIIFGQGAIRCHPYLLKEVELITSPQVDVEQLDRVLMSHIGFFVGNFLRSLAYGFTGGIFITSKVKNRRIAKYQKQLTRMSAAMALLSDTSLILLGGSLKRRERVSARLGDIMSQLYLASAALKYYHDQDQPHADVDYVCWCLQECLYRTQIAINDLLNNFPNRAVAGLLRFTIFPFGQSYYPPSDKLHHDILTPMLTVSELRDRLTKNAYCKKANNELCDQLDQALNMIGVVEPLWKRLQKAVQSGVIPARYNFAERVDKAVAEQLISKDEAEQLKQFESLKNDIIKVAEFSFDLKKIIANSPLKDLHEVYPKEQSGEKNPVDANKEPN